MKGCCNLDAHFITAATFSASFPFLLVWLLARNNALLSRRKKPMKETGMCVHASLSSVEQRRARVERHAARRKLASLPSLSSVRQWPRGEKSFFWGGRRRSGSRPEKTDRSAATLSRTDGGLLIFSAAESRGKEVREWRIEGSIVAPSYFGERGGKEGPDWVWEGQGGGGDLYKRK